MKKFITMIVVLVSVFNLAACSNADYRYADSWSTEKYQYTDALAIVKEYAEPGASEYDAILKNVKDLVKKTIPYAELLDWNKFARLDKTKKINIKATAMSHEIAYIASSYFAFYDEDDDICYVMPKFFDTSSEEKIYILAHEVIHSLVSNRNDADDFQVVEGTVDWLTSAVCSELGLSYSPNYEESIICLKILMDIYGVDQTLRAICEDRIVDLIDGSTKPGMAAKMSSALAIAHSTSSGITEVRSAVYTELDILAHAAKKESVDIDDWFDYVAAVYAEVGIVLDIRYFKNI